MYDGVDVVRTSGVGAGGSVGGTGGLGGMIFKSLGEK